MIEKFDQVYYITFIEASRYKSANSDNFPGSYVFAVKKGTLNNDKEKEMQSALDLDESCYLECGFSLSLMKKAKEFSSLSNLKVYWIRAKEVNGWNPNFMEKEDTQAEFDNATIQIEGDIDEIPETEDFESQKATQIPKKDEEMSACSGHFQKVTLARSQGSFLQFMEDLVKVGHTMGSKWIPNSKSLLIISVYAPQELSEKKVLWDYLHYKIKNWDSEVLIMGNFNENHTQDERFGSNFNTQGAAIFIFFISLSSLVEVSLGGCSFTWVHQSATKMSKLDRFLILKGLMQSCPNISAITMDLYLLDHRLLLLHEICFDYSPTPFRFYHYWFEIEGFDKFVENVWNDYYSDDPNSMTRFMKKMQNLKKKLRSWINSKKESLRNQNFKLKSTMVDIDKILDTGNVNSDLLNKCMNHSTFPRGGNSSFIALTPKSQNANMVKDYRPDKFDWELYTIIAKILANCLVVALGKKKQTMIFKVDFEKAFESVRWDYLDDVNWNKVLVSKEKGDLGVSSFYAINRAFLFKWVWRFKSNNTSLWASFIKAMHGKDSLLGIDLLGLFKKKIGNSFDSSFWEDTWKGDIAFKLLYPRVYALKTCKQINVASKLVHDNLGFSLHRELFNDEKFTAPKVKLSSMRSHKLNDNKKILDSGSLMTIPMEPSTLGEGIKILCIPSTEESPMVVSSGGGGMPNFPA
uniref:RNA-directed DNA polymerase, eukaryota n=1 Tax=Tanacetum cinerariifolium TaxID=118510 RepID=A0A6L2KJS8_TANCI|nr:RNA-directed DNA polymerase, eukaryota [Tanacetum cinerariifolium]